MTSYTIIGGGIMGLSIAFRLAHHLSKNQSCSITLIDSEKPLSASSQAAGILATHGAQNFLSPLRRQIVESTRSYPEFLAAIESVLGKVEVDYHSITHYHLYDESPKQVQALKKRLRRLERERAIDWEKKLPPEPICSILKQSGFFFGKITGLKFNSHYLDPKILLTTLKKAGKALGVKYASGEVIGIHTNRKQDNVTIKYIDKKREHILTTNKVILATGSETKKNLIRIDQKTKQIFPEKFYKLKNLTGTILITDPFLKEFFPSKKILITLANKRYLLHKSDQAFFGSYNFRKQENGNMKIKPKTILKQEILSLFPKFNPQTLELLIGKRLYCHDKLPLLGYINRNLFIATALYKSGLALAPLYSKLAADMLINYNGDEKITDQKLVWETEYLAPLRNKEAQVK